MLHSAYSLTHALTHLSYPGQDKTRLGRILEPFFHKYDRNGDGCIDLIEMHALLAGMHYDMLAGVHEAHP